MARFALVHSPFVGPVSWRALAKTMPEAVVVDYGGVRGPRWYGDVAEAVSIQAGEAPFVAVLHSGAGGFAPAIAAEAGERLSGVVFLDAVLPYPGVSCLSTAPEPLVAHLRRITTEGRLAAWNRWFPEDPTPTMIPDAALREAFVADLPRTPFGFLEAVCPADAWEHLPAAYVQLSQGYAATAAKAEARGWPVLRADLHHLAMASDPEAVANLLRDVAARLETRAESAGNPI
ncbi:alpha/beta fold hydrolase [Phenylobacterium sp.]|uniref:alpha/beta fold hydrolase n=1 Tax=Phenylobacterium sp. TaxID=1871053 RepID=UPI0025F4CAEB|nr:alpha/beta fold hydrolase [Phenylobacterium sp.]